MKERTPDDHFSCSFARAGADYAPERTIENADVQSLVSEIERTTFIKVDAKVIDDDRLFAAVTDGGIAVSRKAVTVLQHHELKWLMLHLAHHAIYPLIARSVGYAEDREKQEVRADMFACVALEEDTELGDLEGSDVGARVITVMIGNDDKSEAQRRIGRLFRPDETRQMLRAA